MEHELVLFDFSGIYKCKKCGLIFVSKNMIICKNEESLCKNINWHNGDNNPYDLTNNGGLK